MKTLLRYGAAIVALAAMGCQTSGVAVPVTRSFSAISPRQFFSSSSLYVANRHSVTVYDFAAGKLLRTILNSNPTAIAIDVRGNLFVANSSTNTVTTYAKDGTSPIRTITQGLRAPRALAFDRAGNLYVANLKNTVTVYAPDSTKLKRTISNGIDGPEAFVFYSSGDLLVGNDGTNYITVYAPGGANPIRTILDHNGPLALALGRSDYLFAVNNYNVTVYKPGGTSPDHTITEGIDLPSTLAFDSAKDLYVANWGISQFRSSISVFAPGQSSPYRTITSGIEYPLALAFDESGDLYVANSRANTITEYLPGSSKVRRIIRQGVNGPTRFATGP